MCHNLPTWQVVNNINMMMNLYKDTPLPLTTRYVSSICVLLCSSNITPTFINLRLTTYVITKFCVTVFVVFSVKATLKGRVKLITNKRFISITT